MSETEINCQDTPTRTCPYCGYAERNHFEVPDEGTTLCPECEKYFRFDSESYRTFSSQKMPCLNGEAPHKFEEKDWVEFTTYFYRTARCCGKSERKPKEVLTES